MSFPVLSFRLSEHESLQNEESEFPTLGKTLLQIEGAFVRACKKNEEKRRGRAGYHQGYILNVVVRCITPAGEEIVVNEEKPLVIAYSIFAFLA